MSTYNPKVLYNEEILQKAGILALIDREGRYQYVSDFWQKSTGMQISAVIGQRVDTMISGSAAQEAMRRKQPVSGVMYYRSQAGRKFTGYVKYIPLKGADQRITGCLVLNLFENQSEASAFATALRSVSQKRKALADSPEGGNAAKYSTDSILGHSAAMQDLKKQIHIAAAIKASCLIEGETGTGKELVAHAVHSHSRRSAFPFVRVNCSAIPENLMESEFFGYEEGSFTGSIKGGRAGKFENANHGSMFLDEINAMHMTMQPKLLRALQEREIERIGGVQSIPVDVRIIAASNKPLLGQIAAGEFRQDLYYRLNIINIYIPPLRERPEDIRVLAKSFIERNNEVFQQHVRGITEEALDYLASYSWPGNVRELQNVVERAMAYGNGRGRLEKEDFLRFGGFMESPYQVHSAEAPPVEAAASPSDAREESVGSTSRRDVRAPFTGTATASSAESRAIEERSAERDTPHTLGSAREDTERRLVLETLQQCGGNKSKAAQLLGISRTMLYKKLEKYTSQG